MYVDEHCNWGVSWVGGGGVSKTRGSEYDGKWWNRLKVGVAEKIMSNLIWKDYVKPAHWFIESFCPYSFSLSTLIFEKHCVQRSEINARDNKDENNLLHLISVESFSQSCPE